MTTNSQKSKSEGIDPHKYGRWQGGITCSHPYSSLQVTKVQRIEVPMAEDNVLTSFLDAAVKTVADVNFTHECIEIQYKCSECAKTGHFTAELVGLTGEEKKNLVPGHYAKVVNVHFAAEPEGMTLEFIKKCYDEMSEDYYLRPPDCKNWTKELWGKLAIDNIVQVNS